MDPKELLAALITEAGELRTKAQSPDFTDDDATRATEVVAEIETVKARIEAQDKARKALASISVVEKHENEPSGDQDPGRTLGERFVKSEAFRGFRKANPREITPETPVRITAKNIGGSGLIRKADPAPLNTVTTGNARAVRTNDVDDLVYRPARRLLEMITRGTTNLPYFQYRQIITKINNAAIVAEGGLKPLSTLETTTADAKAFTYADGMEITNQEIADDGIMQTLVDSTLWENLQILMERILLNGAGTADEPTGLFKTTGVLQQAFAVDAPTSIRKAITKLLTTSSAQIQAVALNPEDDEAWDLLKDKNDRYLGTGPFSQGISSAWGYERIATQAVPVGQAIIGDFKTIHLLDLEGISVEAFNQHKDYAQRNLLYVRAEQRAVQVFRAPAKLCIVDLQAG